MINLFDDLMLEIVKDAIVSYYRSGSIEAKGVCSCDLTFINGVFSPFFCITLPENFEFGVLIAELNHYCLNRIFFPLTVHDHDSLAFSCFISEMMTHYDDKVSLHGMCGECEQWGTKRCMLYPSLKIE